MRNQTAYIITGVKMHEVPMDKSMRIVHRAPPYAVPVESWAENTAVMDVKEEHVEPFHVARQRRVPMSNHRDPFEERIIDEYFIFMPKEVQESMGMLYDIWNDMSTENDKLRQRVHSRKAEGWFKRVHRAMVNKL